MIRVDCIGASWPHGSVDIPLQFCHISRNVQNLRCDWPGTPRPAIPRSLRHRRGLHQSPATLILAWVSKTDCFDILPRQAQCASYVVLRGSANLWVPSEECVNCDSMKCEAQTVWESINLVQSGLSVVARYCEKKSTAPAAT